MKVKAYIIAILGLVLLAFLFIKSRQMPADYPQTIENPPMIDNSQHIHENEELHDSAHNHEATLNEPKKANDIEQTLLGKERFYTEAEIKNMKEEQFVETLRDIERKLPLSSDLRKLPEEALHHTPPQIIQAGKELGLIQEILEIHPQFGTEALVFYEKCIENVERPTPIRALCLTNLIEINKEKGIETPLKKYPQELIDLAKMIIDI